MFSDRKQAVRALLAGAVAAGFGFPAGAAQAQSVVVRSTGPSVATYPQGKKLAANSRVTLKAGES